MVIESKQNKQFKLLKKLMTKKYRDQFDQFLVYGKHLIEKAKKTGNLLEVFTSNNEKNGILIDRKLMAELQQTETFIDEIGLCKKIKNEFVSNRILVLDDIQDPDNVGALLRSASAFGFSKIILSLQSADLYNEKVIRASKGALFDLDIKREPILDTIAYYKTLGYTVIGADAHESKSSIKPDLVLLVMGNEGHGLNPEVKALCDQFYTIKTNHVESLNVSVAGGILMYEWSQLI